MWQQKQNNFMNLDELANLPGETAADKTALWQRLESRLQKKPYQKKAVWYWAAACLLIYVTISLLFSTNKNNVDEAIAVNTNSAVAKPLGQSKRTIAIENIKLETTEIKLPLVVSNVPSLRNKIQLNKTKQDSFVSTAPLSLELLAQDNFVEIDTLENSIAITTKKKISVVHINELEDEDKMAEQNINIAKTLRKKRTKTADRSEYAGILNFRIYFKN